MPTYPEFEALKRYQHIKELPHTKFIRRARGEDRGSQSRSEEQNRRHRLLYTSIAFYSFPFGIFTEQFLKLIRADKVKRADLAGKFYNSCVAIDLLKDANFSVAPTFAAITAHYFILGSINDIITNMLVLAQSENICGASRHLKPMVLQALNKVVDILKETHYRETLGTWLITNQNTIITGLSEDDLRTIQGEIQVLQGTYHREHLIEIQANNPPLLIEIQANNAPPPPISALTIRLFFKWAEELDLTVEDISVMINEYLEATNTDIANCDEAFVQELINCPVATDARGIPLRSYLDNLAPDLETRIKAAIRNLINWSELPHYAP